MRNLLYILLRLLHNYMRCLLLGMGHPKIGMMHLKVGMLHQEQGTLVLELWMWDLHRCTTQKQGFDKLTRL
jgi:hypothetical protein